MAHADTAPLTSTARGCGGGPAACNTGGNTASNTLLKSAKMLLLSRSASVSSGGLHSSETRAVNKILASCRDADSQRGAKASVPRRTHLQRAESSASSSSVSPLWRSSLLRARLRAAPGDCRCSGGHCATAASPALEMQDRTSARESTRKHNFSSRADGALYGKAIRTGHIRGVGTA